VIGVSRDTQEKNDRFAESLGLPYPLVGDPRGAITRAYGVAWPLLGLARRVTYLIRADRRVQQVFHSEFKVAAHAAQVCVRAERG
jgi:peroxiredoxin